MRPRSDRAATSAREVTDRGLARERTELAWTRTSISFAALGGAILKTNPKIGLPILATSALIYTLGRMPHSGTHDRRTRLLAITIACTALALVALVLSFFSAAHPALPR